MGIRMLHRRTPEAVTRAWADTASAQAMPASPVPALAADASTARIPVDLVETVRKTAKGLRYRLTGLTGHVAPAQDWRQWADLARGYLALALTAIPRARPRPTLTVFVASLTDRPAAPGPHRPPRRDHRNPLDPLDGPEPGPDATP
ncbi:hypothetical protein AB0L59_37420 [Streptomyces sp. NPDC052109]|uniref:hypothetical protein n=1 Tax=Streptomyces sp. NPDC052109 TaxID=3155527 RepID=UPI003426E385